MLKKINYFFLGLLSVVFFLIGGVTEAKRYGFYTTSFSATGAKNCSTDGGSGDPICATTTSSSILGSTTCPGNVELSSTTGNMRCWKWDEITPTGSIGYSTPSTTVTVSITCADTGGSGCDMVSISGWTISGSTYSKTFSSNQLGNITLKDKAGNVKTVGYTVTGLDTVPPTGIVSYNPTGWTNSTVTTSILCSDSESGCNMYAISGWTVSGNTYSKIFSSNQAGSIVLKDNANNSSTIAYNVDKIDTIVPTTSATNSSTSWKNSDINVSLSVADTGGSGIAFSNYRLNNSDCWAGGTHFDNNDTRTFTTNGSYILYLCVEDNAGNKKTWSGTYKLDKTAPTLGANPVGGLTWINDTSITLSVADTGLSGIKIAKYKWGSDACSSINTFVNGNSISTIEGTNNLYLCAEDNAGNQTTRTRTYKVDSVAPDFADFTVTLDGENPDGDLLANDSGQLKFTNIGSILESPITINYKLENKDNDAIFSTNDVELSTTITVSWDISKVDNDIETGGDRNYTAKIKLCDQAGNCSSEKEYNWHIYANTPVNNEIINITDLSNTKIGNFDDNFIAGILLKDEYGNLLIPASGIGREITINLVYDNTVYLNQYDEEEGSGILYKMLGDSDYAFMNTGSSQNISKTYTAEPTNGQYIFNIKSYVPTHDGDNRSNGRIRIEKLVYEIIDNSSLLNMSDELTIDKYLSILPIVSTKITGLPPLASEGTAKDFEVALLKTGSVDYDALNFMIDYNSNGEPINTYVKKQNPNTNVDDVLDRCLYATNGIGVANKWDSCDNWYEFNLIDNTSYDFSQGFSLMTGNTLNPEEIGFVSTHLRVRHLDGTYAVWNSDIVGRNNYNYLDVDEFYSTQSAVSISGLIGATSYDKLNQVLEGTAPTLGGTVNKAELRSIINKSVADFVRSKEWLDMSDLKFLNIESPPLDKFEYKDTNIYYYNNDSNYPGAGVILSESVGFIDKHLLIVEGGDVYITKNMHYGDGGILGILSLRRDDKGGNIYVHKDVTNLDALMYADGALISYSGTPGDSDFITQEAMSQSELKNQILIRGVLWSFNTLGASRSDIPYCPYFYPDGEICDLLAAQKYDLEYFRRFYLVKPSVYVETADEKAWIPYYSPQALLAGNVKCDLEDEGGDGDMDVVCISSNYNLENRFGITATNNKIYNPFGGDGTDMTSTQKEKAAPIILEYDGRFKTNYMPIFTDGVY